MRLGHSSLVLLALLALSGIPACSLGADHDGASSESDVIGGRNESGFAPVGFVADANRKVVCTATLIAPDAAVTAAHCSNMTHFGLGKLEDNKLYAIARIYRHPLFRKGPTLADWPHDIAIVKLSAPIASASVAKVAPAVVGSGYRAVGYGRTEITTETGSRKSMAYDLTEIDPIHLVGTPSEAGTLCYGDSGGPLMKDQSLELVGLTQGTMDPRVTGCPSGAAIAFTNVNTQIGFIQDALACNEPDTYGNLPFVCRNAVENDVSIRPGETFPVEPHEVGRIPGQVGTPLHNASAVKAYEDVTCAGAYPYTGYFCAGDNAFGQLGVASAVEAEFAFRQRDFGGVLAGGESSLVVRTNGTHRLFGKLQLGASLLGGGRWPAMPADAGTNLISAAIVGDALYAVTDGGHLFGVGSLAGSWPSSVGFVDLSVSKVRNVVAGYGHGCVELDGANGRTLACFGSNTSGETDSGSPSAGSKGLTPVPLPHPLLAPWSDPYSVALGEGYTCAIVRGGASERELYCWGKYPGATSARPPTKVASGAIEVVSGRRHVCFVIPAEQREMECFGDNGDGQLGDGTFTDRDTPVPVVLPYAAGAPGAVRAIAAGRRHTCAIGGEFLFCWGANDKGQAGIGHVAMPKINRPVRAVQL